MKTRILTRDQVDEAAEIIVRGGLVVFPTETVYGLGADATNDVACQRIYKVKQRPPDNPCIVHVLQVSQIDALASGIPPGARALITTLTPGPLTIVLNKKSTVSDVACAGQSTIALRIPANPVARTLIRLSALPIAAPSANPSGRPSATSFDMAYDYMNGKVEAIIDGGDCPVGIESTIVRIHTQQNGNPMLEILRLGAITENMLLCAIRNAGHTVELSEKSDAPPLPTPGSAHVHYRPHARVEILPAEKIGARARQCIAENKTPGLICLPNTALHLDDLPHLCVVHSLSEYAQLLYQLFWKFDRSGCDIVLAEQPLKRGIGPAILDRLWRAAT